MYQEKKPFEIRQRVYYIDMHIECIVLTEPNVYGSMRIKDLVTGVQVHVNEQEIDHDIEFYRNEKLEKLLG